MLVLLSHFLSQNPYLSLVVGALEVVVEEGFGV
jgi:hypothetical protein